MLRQSHMPDARCRNQHFKHQSNHQSKPKGVLCKPFLSQHTVADRRATAAARRCLATGACFVTRIALTRVVPQSVLISPKVSMQACMQMPASNASMRGADSREPDALIRLLHHHSLLLTHVLMAGSLRCCPRSLLCALLQSA